MSRAKPKSAVSVTQTPAPAEPGPIIGPANRGKMIAQVSIAPAMRHAMASQAYAAPVMGDEASWVDTTDALAERMKSARSGNKKVASDMLTAQAVTLDTVFTEMLRRAGDNMGEYPEAAERYMRMALKAQANSRATLEALMRLHQPREQTVKHVHVNAGGQAVVADEFHHHSGGRNVESADQPYEPITALPGPNPLGNGVPMPGAQRQEAVPPARRRKRKRGTEGQP